MEDFLGLDRAVQNCPFGVVALSYFNSVGNTEASHGFALLYETIPVKYTERERVLHSSTSNTRTTDSNSATCTGGYGRRGRQCKRKTKKQYHENMIFHINSKAKCAHVWHVIIHTHNRLEEKKSSLGDVTKKHRHQRHHVETETSDWNVLMVLVQCSVSENHTLRDDGWWFVQKKVKD